MCGQQNDRGDHSVASLSYGRYDRGAIAIHNTRAKQAMKRAYNTELWRAHRQIMDLIDMLRRETQGNAARVSDQNREAWRDICEQCCVLAQKIRRGMGQSGTAATHNTSKEYRERERLQKQRDTAASKA